MMAALEALGLTAYEARALAYLLRHGERTGPVVSREAEIPFGRVYDTLHALAERGLVHVESGRPKRFRAAPAGTVPGRLLASNQRRLQDEQRSLEVRAQDLGRQLEDLTAKPEPSGAYGVRLGEESAREFLVEATLEARKHVVAALALERIEEEDLAIFDAFRQAVARGVRTRLVLRASDVDYLLTTPYVDQVLDAMLPHLGENLAVRLLWGEGSDVPFAAVDRERAMLGVKNPLDPQAYFAVIHVDDSVFAMGLEGRFDALWEEAEEPADLVQWALGKKGGRALAKFGAKLRR
ncbi:MAG: TrmB family transcriptional regulator [Thermoplasmatota archaeon]